MFLKLRKEAVPLDIFSVRLYLKVSIFISYILHLTYVQGVKKIKQKAAMLPKQQE